MFRFAEQNMLFLLLICVFFVSLLWLYIRHKKRALKDFGDSSLVATLAPHFSSKRPFYKHLTLILALAFVVLALARPQFGEKTEVVKREGIEIMVALDVSNSMLAEDITPNRLERAKRALSRLLESLQDDRLGLVVFAGDAYVQLPITHDFSAAKLFISTINTDLIPKQGTSIGSAISLATRSFTSDSDIGKAIIIITDGEEHEGDAIAMAKMAKEKGIHVFTLGMGLEKGAPIPHNNGDYKKDAQGNVVISKLNENFLKQIAAAAGGSYIRANNTSVGLNQIVNDIEQLNKKEFESTEFTAQAEQFQYFIGIALCLIILSFFILERKNKNLDRFNIFNPKSTAE